MPPKPTGKKGDSEDFSDASTLPQANIFKFTLVHKSFLSQESRDKVRQVVKDKLVPTSLGKIVSLTRDDIVTYGKSKTYILDASQLAALPQDDPRRSLSESDMVAKSAADRIFELSVLIRRQKATRPVPTDEEEKKLAEDQVDGSIYLVDYPQTRAEILSFSKYSQSLHTVFEIEEVFAQPEINTQEEENEEQQVVQPEVVQTTQDSQEQQAAAISIIQAFKSARQDCDVRSPLRNLAVLRVAFKNITQSFIGTEADGSAFEKTRSPEDCFVSELVAKNIDKYAQYYFQYLRFKRTVQTHPLVPDQVVKNKLAQLSVQQERDRKSVESLRELSKTMAQGDEEYQKAQQEIAHLESKISERVSMSKDLTRRSKKSLDDEPSQQQEADMLAYNNDFVKNSETSNKISSILSAMVTHIEHVNQDAHETSQVVQASPNLKTSVDASTADESALSDIFDRYATEIACDLSLMSRGPDPVDAPNPADTLTQKHNKGILIHDETNKTLEVKQTAPLSVLESDQDRLNQIADREQQIFANLLVPGKNRSGMPQIPLQSKRLREAENPQFYPFCTLSVDEAERLLCLRAFQQMLRSNGIDEGKQGLAKHTRYQVFERNFENHMTKEIFAQVLADGLLDDPDVDQVYYPRTDSVLLALYNKHQKPIVAESQNFKVVSTDELLPTNHEVFDYERQWRAKYRIMPDFENWIAYFADEIIQENEILKPVKKEEAPAVADPVPPAGKVPVKGQAQAADAVDPNAVPVTLMRYLIDEELLPRQLFSVEDAKVQSVMEKSAFLYPDDNSVMRVDHFSVGGQKFKKSLVIKDNLKFGLRERQEGSSKSVTDADYGLVSQAVCGDTEFFLHFENGTKLGVEQVKLTRNPQRTIKIPARQMTAEEKAYQNEQKAKLAEATAKALKANKPPPTDIEIPKDPEPTWEKEPLSYFDLLFSDDEIDQSSAKMTLTFINGLIVQYLGSGHIIQLQEKSIGVKSGEVNRLITKEGVLIRQLANKDAEMLFPDGVRAFFSKQNLEWIVTNNKGLQRSLKDGVFKDLKPTPCAMETDSETGSRMMIREDGVLAVTYKDGSLFCQHKDGTKMHTSADGNEIIIEKFGFASHVIKRTDARTSGQNDAFGRAVDGVVVETFLPDGTKTQTFADDIQTKKSELIVYRTLITRQDLSVVLTDSEGHVSVITSNTRAALNELGGKTKLGIKDTDYLEELLRAYGQYTPQVYQAHINRSPQKSHIKTKNVADDTIFVLRSDLTLDKIVLNQVRKTGSANQKEQDRQKRKFAKAVSYVADEFAGNRIMDVEIEETGGFQEPHLKYYSTPRLFVINNDGSAKELLSQLQLEYALRTKGLQPESSLKLKTQDVFNNHHVETAFYLTKVINMTQVQVSQQTLNKIDLPENAKEVLQEKAVVQDYTLQLPKQDQFLFSSVFKMPDCDSIVQTSFANDYERFVQWKMGQVRYETEFGIIHAPTTKDAKVDLEKINDEMSDNKRILVRILKHRAQPREKFQSELFRTQAIKEMQSSETVKAFRESGQKNSTYNSLSSSTDKPGFGKKTVKVQSQLERDPTVKVNKKTNMPNQANTQKLREKVDKKLSDLNQLKQASDFIPEYFECSAGQEFISQNPQKPPSEEVLTRMKQRMERMNKQNMQNMPGDTDFEGENNQHQSVPEEARDNPIVALEPDELKQGSRFTGSKRNEKSQIQADGSVHQAEDDGPVIYPSLYMQEKMYILQKEQEALLKSEEHHIVKTKDFNVYGRLREEKPFVKTIQKSNAQSDLNEKFITTECITDRRIKISSQAPRFYMNAPSVEDVRKQGQHQMILGAIEKKQTFSELINQANSMVTGVLHDTLKRSINVMPSAVVFGSVRTGTINEILMTLKNEDSIAHRITIKPLNDKRIVVKQLEYGIIAPGMLKQVSVSIRVAEDESNLPSKVEDVIQIVTKHDIFKVPVSATILSASEFEEANDQNLQQTGKPIQNSRVKERLLSKIADSKEQDGPVKLTSLPIQK